VSQAGELTYLDSSALVKVVLEESETARLLSLLADGRTQVSSVVADVEVHRAARREAEAAAERATEVLEFVNLIELDRAILDVARAVEPDRLRTLDAIHIATALSLGDDLDIFVTYDRRQAEAATSAGLDVRAPE
jgi:predicted nucleic acid-binding protein